MKREWINVILYGVFAFASLLGLISNIVPIINQSYLNNDSLSLGQLITFALVFLLILLLAIKGCLRSIAKAKATPDENE